MNKKYIRKGIFSVTALSMMAILPLSIINFNKQHYSNVDEINVYSVSSTGADFLQVGNGTTSGNDYEALVIDAQEINTYEFLSYYNADNGAYSSLTSGEMNQYDDIDNDGNNDYELTYGSVSGSSDSIDFSSDKFRENLIEYDVAYTTTTLEDSNNGSWIINVNIFLPAIEYFSSDLGDYSDWSNPNNENSYNITGVSNAIATTFNDQFVATIKFAGEEEFMMMSDFRLSGTELIYYYGSQNSDKIKANYNIYTASFEVPMYEGVYEVSVYNDATAGSVSMQNDSIVLENDESLEMDEFTYSYLSDENNKDYSFTFDIGDYVDVSGYYPTYSFNNENVISKEELDSLLSTAEGVDSVRGNIVEFSINFDYGSAKYNVENVDAWYADYEGRGASNNVVGKMAPKLEVFINLTPNNQVNNQGIIINSNVDNYDQLPTASGSYFYLTGDATTSNSFNIDIGIDLTNNTNYLTYNVDVLGYESGDYTEGEINSYSFTDLMSLVFYGNNFTYQNTQSTNIQSVENYLNTNTFDYSKNIGQKTGTDEVFHTKNNLLSDITYGDSGNLEFSYSFNDPSISLRMYNPQDSTWHTYLLPDTENYYSQLEGVDNSANVVLLVVLGIVVVVAAGGLLYFFVIRK